MFALLIEVIAPNSLVELSLIRTSMVGANALQSEKSDWIIARALDRVVCLTTMFAFELFRYQGRSVS